MFNIDLLAWNGDTWKAAVYMRLQDGLELVIIDIDHGVAVLRRQLNRHRMPVDIESRVQGGGIDNLDWKFLQTERENVLRLVTMNEMRAWLDEGDSRSVIKPESCYNDFIPPNT